MTTVPRLGVGAEPRTIVDAARGHREPLVGRDAETAAVLEHRVDERLADLDAVGLVGIVQHRIGRRERGCRRRRRRGPAARDRGGRHRGRRQASCHRRDLQFDALQRLLEVASFPAA